MKKVIIFLLLLTSLYSDAKIYTGLGIGFLNEKFSDKENTSNSAEMAKFKIGYGIRSSYAIELSLDYLKNESNVFTQNDGSKFGINVELIKAFDKVFSYDIYIKPYFKAGFGAGYFTIEDQDKNSLKYGSFNTGLGFFIPINEHFDIEVGYDYKYLSYQKFEAIGDDINSNLNGICIGFNARY